ncbi:hypothetical protein Ae168Ps1_6227 [Pseudonocardia sp. Ae168_Ps1]|nr:hypothetical protein Ae168Ps1_6227 [Pseudonocardia sp. Ae168_Ps1]OLL71600.1 hypothetical protein Ae263Ps1_6088 [Pseudonocardia sp. Ae263_Ps1]
MAPFSFVSGRGRAGSTLRGPGPSRRRRRRRPVDPADATDLDPFLTDAQVADWPHTTKGEDGAAQRLARPREPARLLGPSTLPEDECESPFR